MNKLTSKQTTSITPVNMNRLSKYTLGLLAILYLLLVTSCKKKEQQAAQAPPPDISVARPVVRNIVLTKEYPGYLTSEQTVNLVGRVSGTLQSVLFKPGTEVKKGQLLFVIEPTIYRDNVTKAKAALETAQAQLEYARNSYERMVEAAKSDAVSKIQVLQAQSNVAETEAAVDNARAELSTAETNLSYAYIRAPFSGMIDRNQYDVGNYINGSVQPVTLATLYKNETMYVYFNIEDNQYMKMLLMQPHPESNEKLPHEVAVTPGTDTGVRYTGKLDYLSPNVDLSTGTLNIRAEVPNVNGTLKSGLYVTITLPYGEQKDAVLVSDASIGTDQLGKYVYIVNDSNIVRYRHITTGQLVNDSLRQVVKGLTGNDRYVTTALLKVRDGMKIHPVN